MMGMGRDGDGTYGDGYSSFIDSLYQSFHVFDFELHHSVRHL